MSKALLKSEIDIYVINKVRELRIAAGISQADLALALDLSVGFIGHIESPKYRAKYNLSHLNRLATILNCSIKDFFPELPL
ncbi:transcriptional regulator [Pedobacter ginsengisoli]|uniref:Transcriptional regulator n=1 Tax=Pedobacter ginsengisoli TaxID=363852 RepID=A0A2D1U3R9_9SPHI|nr:helix-turn-helix transcriptional regulator [Pedobacter ginsengisoli]ATP56228.1 transcriptional regulator [Pedobacter ginsengisoli]